MPEMSKLNKVTARVKKFIDWRQQRICRDQLTRLNDGGSGSTRPRLDNAILRTEMTLAENIAQLLKVIEEAKFVRMEAPSRLRVYVSKWKSPSI
jgi:hypothetical protein